MLGSNLERAIRENQTNEVYVSYTISDMDQHCTVFDLKLGDLCNKMREIPGIGFNSHGAAESHKILLPRQRSAEVSERIISILKESELSITSENLFGGKLIVDPRHAENRQSV